MGKIISKLNPFRDFNIESRAQKIISKEKPLPAPKHQPDVELYEQVLKGNVELEQKNERLDDHLKNVYVKSTDPKVPEHKYLKESYPQDRSPVENFSFGFKDPKNIPRGKMILKDIVQCITNYQAKPREFDFTAVSNKHYISEEKLRTIFKHFKIFEIHMPDEAGVRYAERTKPRLEVTIEEPKQLDDSKKS